MEVDVLIVGAGPAGLSAAVPVSCSIEKSSTTFDYFDYSSRKRYNRRKAHIRSCALLRTKGFKCITSQLERTRDTHWYSNYRRYFLFFNGKNPESFLN